MSKQIYGRARQNAISTGEPYAQIEKSELKNRLSKAVDIQSMSRLSKSDILLTKKFQKQAWPIWKRALIGTAAVLTTAILVQIFATYFFFPNQMTVLAQASERARKEGALLLQNVEKVLDEEGRIEWNQDASLNGIYLVKNLMGEVIASFKPEDERAFAPNNRNVLLQREEHSAEQILKESVWEQGLHTQRQFLYRLLDIGNDARIPTGVIAILESDLFFDKNYDANQIPRKLRKIGYLQTWIPEAKSLTKLASKDGLEYDFSGFSLLNDVPINEFQKVGILDFISFNVDRHGDNVLISVDSEGIPHMIPIDHDHAFPCSLKFFYGGIFTHSLAEKPFTDESRQLIDQLDLQTIEALIIKSELPEQVVRNTKALVRVLKTFIKDPKITLADLYEFARTPTLRTGHSAIGLILDETHKKAIQKFDENEIDSIKFRSWTEPEKVRPEELRKLWEYDKVFWTEFQASIDTESQKISSKIALNS